MQSVTRSYLTGIIFRSVNQNINLHRKSKLGFLSDYQLSVPATESEVADFIQSTPYFDDRLKDFLFGNVPDENVIISQAWEIEFIRKCQLWADSFEWLDGDRSYLSDSHLVSLKKQAAFLSLPY